MPNPSLPLPVAADPIVNKLMEKLAVRHDSHPSLDVLLAKFKARADFGFKKYGMTTDANPLSLLQWINHMQEEVMDALVYAERILKEYHDGVLDDYITQLGDMALFLTLSKEVIEKHNGLPQG